MFDRHIRPFLHIVTGCWALLYDDRVLRGADIRRWRSKQRKLVPLLRQASSRSRCGPGAGGGRTWGRGNKTQWLILLMCRTCKRSLRRSRSSWTPRQAGRAENQIEFPAGLMAGYQWIKTVMNGHEIWISMDKKEYITGNEGISSWI